MNTERTNLVGIGLDVATLDAYNASDTIHQSALQYIARKEFSKLDPEVRDEIQEGFQTNNAVQMGNLFEYIVQHKTKPEWLMVQKYAAPTATMGVLAEILIDQNVDPTNVDKILSIMDFNKMWGSTKAEAKRRELATLNDEVAGYVKEQQDIKAKLEKGYVLMSEEDIKAVETKAFETIERINSWFPNAEIYWQVPFVKEGTFYDLFSFEFHFDNDLYSLASLLNINVNEKIKLAGIYDAVIKTKLGTFIVDLKYSIKNYESEYWYDKYIQERIYSNVSGKSFAFIVAHHNKESLIIMPPYAENSQKLWSENVIFPNGRKIASVGELVLKYLWLRKNNIYTIDPEIIERNYIISIQKPI
jgi:hypothetical protein